MSSGVSGSTSFAVRAMRSDTIDYPFVDFEVRGSLVLQEPEGELVGRPDDAPDGLQLVVVPRRVDHHEDGRAPPRLGVDVDLAPALHHDFVAQLSGQGEVQAAVGVEVSELPAR